MYIKTNRDVGDNCSHMELLNTCCELQIIGFAYKQCVLAGS